MPRAFFASTCLALALVLVIGCGSQGGGGGNPKVADPNDPKAKELKPLIPGGGGGNKVAPQ
jgi:hypothetical protein